MTTKTSLFTTANRNAVWRVRFSKSAMKKTSGKTGGFLKESAGLRRTSAPLGFQHLKVCDFYLADVIDIRRAERVRSRILRHHPKL